MEATYLYLGLTLVSIAGAVFFRRLVSDRGVRHRIAAWALILFGASALVAAALESGHAWFFVAAGLLFVVAGIVDLFAWPTESTNVRPHA